ncbi:MAG: protein translocase subunit SecF [Acidobacteria bacterium]|nr:protein translocase subunit SecF [Acidobacteriota bacterium]
MQLLKHTNIDFMGPRKLWMGVSLALMIASALVLGVSGLKQGVEFAGGAEVVLHFVEKPDLDQIRAALGNAGFEGVSATTFGDTGDREVAIRVALPESTDSAAEVTRDLAKSIVGTLQPADVRERVEAGKLDLNVADQVTLADRLRSANLPSEEAEAVAEAIASFRRERSGVVASLEEALSLPGVTEAAKSVLRDMAFVGPFGLRGQEVIAGAVSGEMREKAYLAIVGALVFMGIYIAFRFQVQYALAAILALVHDTLITLGAFSLAGMEANLPVVAAFLTLVGYSVNDTIVVFDRIRETIKARGMGNFTAVINDAINQTLSRTLITSGTTWIVVVAMYVFGGPVIRPFAFVLLIGILIGTYSSIYVASPLLLFWQEYFGKRAAARASKPTAKAAARG